MKKRTKLLALFAAIIMCFAVACCFVGCGDDTLGSGKITLSSSSLTLEEGKSTAITVTVNGIDQTVEWEIADETVVSVSPVSTAVYSVNGLKAGTTTVTFKAGDQTAKCTVTVSAKQGEEPPIVTPPSTDAVDVENGGESGEFTGWRYWFGEGTVNVSSCKYDTKKNELYLKYTCTDGLFYSMQLFYKDKLTGIDHGVSLTIVSPIEASITVNGVKQELAVGENTISVENYNGSTLSVQFGVDGEFTVKGEDLEFVFKDLVVTSHAVGELKAPAFTYADDTMVITITDADNDASKVSKYELGLFAKADDALPAYKVYVVGGEAVALDTVPSGTYTAKVRAIGVENVIDSGWSESTATIEWVNSKTPLEYKANEEISAGSKTWYVWYRNWGDQQSSIEEAYIKEGDIYLKGIVSRNQEVWDVQLFYKGEAYSKLSFTVTASQAGKITVNGTVFELEAGVAKAVEVTAGSPNVSIQMGGDDVANNLQGDVTIKDIEFTYTTGGENPPQPPTPPQGITWEIQPDAIYGEVTENGADYIWHHLFFNDAVAKAYDFDSYDVTVTLDGEAGEVVDKQNINTDNIAAHTYHLHIRIKGNRYQTTVFTVSFKKDGEVVETATYTRNGDREVVLDSTSETVSKGDTVTINVTKINGSTNLDGKVISWTIADTEGEGVATIPENSTGGSVTVTATAAGKATLTCTVGEGDDAVSKTCVITVVEGAVVIVAQDVSEKMVFNDKFKTSKEAIQVRCHLDGAEFAELAQKIDPAQTTVEVTMDGNDSTGNIIHKQWQAENVYIMYIQVEVESNWEHDYTFRFSFKNNKGEEIAYANYTEAAPKGLYLDNTKLDLTLKTGETVTGTITARTTGQIEGDIVWAVDDTSVATITVSEDKLSVTVTAVAKGTATVTATVDGLEQTCAINVLNEGEVVEKPQSTYEFTFVEVYNDHYMHFSGLPTSLSFNYVKVYKDNDTEGRQFASEFVDGHLRVYVTDTANAFAGDWKFEFYKDGNVVATLYFTYPVAS